MSESVVYGFHAVINAIKNPKRGVKNLIVQRERQDKRLSEVIELARKQQIKIDYLTKKDIEQRYPDAVTQGVIALASAARSYNEKDIAELLAEKTKPALILILDGVTDAHNLGACLRTADAAGVDFVLIPKDKSASVTAVVSKVACGAAESIPIVTVTNLVRAMEELKKAGVWLYGTAGEAEQNIYQMNLTGDVAIIMGAEGRGMRRLTREHCDGLFHLPMHGIVDSLNVSVATGVCLFEVVRQRRSCV